MQLETFRGRDLLEVVRHVRRTLGSGAMIVDTEVIERSSYNLYQVIAIREGALDEFRRQLSGALTGGLAAARRVRNRRHIGPYVIGLVGPPGSGKTTSAVKLALHPEGIGTDSVGIITLDTYRIGALEELETYSEVTDIPLEAVYHAREMASALERLRHLEVVIVDAPGRSVQGNGWAPALRQARPDEVHLVLQAGLRTDVALGIRSAFESCGLTHVMFTKLDEVARDVGLAELANAMELPSRWLSDGPDVPASLCAAPDRIVQSLGRRSELSHVRRHAG